MGKRIRAFFVLLLMCGALWSAPNYTQQLEQYDAQLKGANNDEMLRVFHGLKAIYIQAIIGSDNALKKETLTRLIKTAKMLKLDASKYESELATMNKDPKKTAPSKPLIPPPADEESFGSSSSTPATATSSSMPLPPTVTKESKGTSAFEGTSTNTHIASSLPKSYNGKNVLHQVTSSEEEIVLDFGTAVAENSIKVFVLRTTDGYKKIIDLPAVIMNAPLNIITPKKLKNLRISQYNSNTIRIILDAPSAFETYVSVLDTQVILSLDKKPTLTQKRITTPVVEPPKKTSIDSKVSSKTSTATTPEPSSKMPMHAESPAPLPSVATVKSAPSHTNKGQKKDKTIVIDAGHGGKDAGVIGYKGRMEKHLVLDVALQLGKELRSRGYKVYFTRQKDVFINLRDRTKVANDKNADLFISVHANAAPNDAKKLSMKGLETFFLSPDRSERSKNVAALENQSDMEEMDFYSKETFLNVFNREKIVLSNKVAIDVQSSMLNTIRKKYSVEDGGVREAPFWVLVGATMPSILVEVGYISNPEESDNMFNPQYQRYLVEGISDGVDRYYVNNP